MFSANLHTFATRLSISFMRRLHQSSPRAKKSASLLLLSSVLPVAAAVFATASGSGHGTPVVNPPINTLTPSSVLPSAFPSGGFPRAYFLPHRPHLRHPRPLRPRPRLLRRRLAPPFSQRRTFAKQSVLETSSRRISTPPVRLSARATMTTYAFLSVTFI